MIHKKQKTIKENYKILNKNYYNKQYNLNNKMQNN